LEDANVKLASVVTDIRGVSARAMLAALLAGETDPAVLAELARGRMRSKREVLAQAVVGRFTAHHAFLITEHLSQLDYLLKVYRMTDELTLPAAIEVLQPYAADGSPFVLLGGHSDGVGGRPSPTPVLA